MARIWNKNFTLLFVIQTCDILTYNMITPIVATYATQAGASIVQAGVLASAFMLAAVIVRPFSGFISDQTNRKYLILITVAICAISLFAYAISPSLAVFAAFRILHGFAYAVFGTVIAAAAYSFIPEGREGEGMGFFSLSYTIGSALGPGIGIYVGQYLGFNSLFILAGCALVASLIVGFTLPDIACPNSARHKPKSIKDLIIFKALPVMGIMIILCANWGAISTFIVLTADARGVAGIAAFFTLNAIALFITRPPAGRFADRHGLSKLFYPAIFIEALAMAALAFAHQLWAFLAISVLKAMGHGVIHPALQAESIKLEKPERSGVATSTFLLGTDIGYTLGPIFAGFVVEQSGYTGMYLACVPITIIAALVYFIWKRHLKTSREL